MLTRISSGSFSQTSAICNDRLVHRAGSDIMEVSNVNFMEKQQMTFYILAVSDIIVQSINLTMFKKFQSE